MIKQVQENGMTGLSDRLRTISGMVSDHSLLLDVGCDHAYVSIDLVSKERVRLAYASDVRKGPLEAARRNIGEAGLSDRIKTAVCDGIPEDFVENLPLGEGEHRSVVIAGMGGRLILSILEKAKDRLGEIDEFILSPQSEYVAFRAGITKLGLLIEDENLLKEEGKYYVVIRAVHAENPAPPLSETQLWFGPRLLEEKSELFLEYLRKQKATLEKIAVQLKMQKTENAKVRLAEIEHELDLIDQAMK